jgi:hypothetical protein
MSAANGNGWFGELAATWRKLRRAPQPAHGVKQKPSRSSSAEMAFLTHIDPTRNIDRFYIVEVTSTLFGQWAVLREWGKPRLGRHRADLELRARRRRAIRVAHDRRAAAAGYVQTAPARSR